MDELNGKLDGWRKEKEKQQKETECGYYLEWNTKRKRNFKKYREETLRKKKDIYGDEAQKTDYLWRGYWSEVAQWCCQKYWQDSISWVCKK